MCSKCGKAFKRAVHLRDHETLHSGKLSNGKHYIFKTLVRGWLTILLLGQVWDISRDGSVSKMCTSGGRQCKTVPNSGLRVLVHPK